jgi:hypothetical protein
VNRDEIIKGLQQRLKALDAERELIDATLTLLGTPPQARGYVRLSAYRDWVVKQKSPFTAGDVAVAFGKTSGGVKPALQKLERSGILRDAGKRGNAKLYEYVPPNGAGAAATRDAATARAQRKRAAGRGGSPVAATGRATPISRPMAPVLEGLRPDLTVVRAGSGHIKVMDGDAVVATVPSTPSDHRAVKNTRASLKRKGLLA